MIRQMAEFAVDGFESFEGLNSVMIGLELSRNRDVANN
jgi:hypothetical protein